MVVVICAMAKNENDYINEWVKHYVYLGIDKIYLYDNNEIDTPYVGDFIDKEYRSKVEIIDIRGRKEEKLQHKIYTNFYTKYSHTFDWCLYCDIDEFLFGIVNFHSWLLQPIYKNAYQIRVMWKLFGDDNLIERDMSKGVVETFKIPLHKSLNRNLIDKGNLEIQGKMLVRGGMTNIVVRSPHFASIGYRDNIIPSILPSGRVCYSKVVIYEDYSNEKVYLHHYMTKSLSEFVKQKLNRTDAVFGNTLPIDYYWRINEKTNEKLEYLRKLNIKV